MITLIATDADSDVRLGDHTHIIRTVANGQCDFGWLVSLDQSNHLSLLLRGKPACNKHLARESELHEALSKPSALLDFEKAIALNHCSIVQFRKTTHIMLMDLLELRNDKVHQLLLAFLLDLEYLDIVVKNLA